MIPAALLNYSVRGGVVVPRFLGASDTPWLRLLIDEVERFAGRREAELDERLSIPIAEGVDMRKQRLAVAVLRKSVATAHHSVVRPEAARAALFLAASATSSSRQNLLLQVAKELGTSGADIEDALFADLPGQRFVGTLPTAVSPVELMLRTNLALARGLLGHACAVKIELEGNARAIVRQAKLRRLICGVRPRSAYGVVLEISGPFALFRHTRVYGRALGELLPLLAWCRRFRLQATCVLGERSLTLQLASGDPIFPSAEPRRFDSKIEERFFRDFARLAPDWVVVREPGPILAKPWLLFPDFALTDRHQPERRWYVEIVGFWTERYLERKLAAYRAAKLGNSHPVHLR